MVDVGGLVGGEPPHSMTKVSQGVPGIVMAEAGGHGHAVRQELRRKVQPPEELPL